ncbi:glycosyltransferase family 2 protein [Paenibacillus agricola]|uniref:Glycosyltransferase family 2 protein n=1 Tax=Paenibacillus agricola TaxID=2716264 RepID=A0ABX0JCW2_9BACL|nr:glycosyltransferase family 2 protein [Paenibacillus agricola]NHN34327.1 glycosyltransferase family 2 protein [Paenibacillus agricola]
MKMVSVIIPTFRRPLFLQRAIDSVLNQNYENIQIIVVDDNGIGTTDQIETFKIIEKYQALNSFKYITHKTNLNGSSARNTGIREAKGEYICFLDDDDEFEQFKISKQVELLESLNNDWGACYTGHTRVYPTGAHLEYTANIEGNLVFNILGCKVDLCAGSTLMIKQEIINNIGFFDESFARHQDIEFVLRVAQFYKITCVKESLVKIYMHPSSNRSKNAEQFEFRKKYFLETFKSFIDNLTPEDKRYVYFVNYIDIAKQYLKEKKARKFLEYINISGKPIIGLFKVFLDTISFYIRQQRIKLGK